jgi:hypothetical protein
MIAVRYARSSPGTAALRDFNPLFVGFGSKAANEVMAGYGFISAVLQKRTQISAFSACDDKQADASLSPLSANKRHMHRSKFDQHFRPENCEARRD